MSMASLLLQSWLLLVMSLDQTSAEYKEDVIDEGRGSSLSSDTRIDANLVFYKPTFRQDYREPNGIFQTTSVTSLMECLFQCASHVFCTAINYREDFLPEKMTENCQLIQLIGESVELVKDVGYRFYLLIQDNLETIESCSSPPHDAESGSCLCSQGDTGQICEQVCSEPKELGMRNGLISDSQISASSEWDPSLSSSNSRLFYAPNGDRTGSWSSKTNDNNQWLQVDFERPTAIVGVSTQGRAGNPTERQYVTNYTLSYSQDGVSFHAYRPHCHLKVFEGNFDRDTVVNQSLPTTITARYIRVHPTTWFKHISMRVEFHGLYIDCDGAKDLGMRSGKIQASQITASSEYEPTTYGPNNARLFFQARNGREGSWASESSDLNQWLQVDFQRQTVVVGISTQGREDASTQWVKTYTLSYSIDGVSFSTYKHDGQVKVFNGNTDTYSVVHNAISPAIVARHIKVEPKSWNKHISLRVEFYGC